MKSYEKMAENVFRRISEYETLQKQKQKRRMQIAVPLVCLCLAAAIGIGGWQIGIGDPDLPAVSEPPVGSAAGDPGGLAQAESLTIPALELPKGSDGISADMIALVVYNGGIYTGAKVYSGAEAEAIETLLGEHLGYATGEITCFSSQEDYAADFSSTIRGDVYSVKGYSTDFRLCIPQSYQEDDGTTITFIYFLERLNGITITDGADLFGDRLGLMGRVASVEYQTYENWNNGDPENYVHSALQGVSSEQFDRFLAALYAAPFEYVYNRDSHFYDSSKRQQAFLYLHLNDGTVVGLRLFEDGYVGYQHMPWYFVKLPGEAFDPIFAACRS